MSNNKTHNYFHNLKGHTIKEFEILEGGKGLNIITKSGLIFYIESVTIYEDIFLENKLEYLDQILNEEIIKAEEVEMYCKGKDLLFFYNIESFKSSIQIRFIGSDDAYYASEVIVYTNII